MRSYKDMKNVLAIDIGSSSLKVGIYKLENEIKNVCSNVVSISLYSEKPGYLENDPNEVYTKLCTAIYDLLKNNNIDSEDIGIVSICSHAQCVLLVDEQGRPLTPVYNSQDARAKDSFNKYFADGMIKVDGVNLFKIAKCFIATGFMPGTAKDPVFKYKWVEDNLPKLYEKAHKWIDIKDYVIMCLTGVIATTKDNAHAYTIYNSRENKGNWSKTVSKIFKVDMEKLPKVVESTDVVGYVQDEISKKTGLKVGTPVVGGIIDSTGIQYGSGAADIGEAMIYWGTSGWVGTVIDKLKINFISRMGALISAIDSRYHYYASLDSAGISYEWLKSHIVEDDDILEAKDKCNISKEHIYNRMNESLRTVKAGSDGLMYAPWLTGCRAPMEASDIGGMFINIKNNMNKKYMIRAVVEGICYQYRYLLELGEWQTGKIRRLRFVGGGANSDEISQILADITGCIIEVPINPRNAGAIGAAIVGFSVLSGEEIDIIDMAHKQKAEKTFIPNNENYELYSKYYSIFKKLYKYNKRILSGLTLVSEGR